MQAAAVGLGRLLVRADQQKQPQDSLPPPHSTPLRLAADAVPQLHHKHRQAPMPPVPDRALIPFRFMQAAGLGQLLNRAASPGALGAAADWFRFVAGA